MEAQTIFFWNSFTMSPIHLVLSMQFTFHCNDSVRYQHIGQIILQLKILRLRKLSNWHEITYLKKQTQGNPCESQPHNNTVRYHSEHSTPGLDIILFKKPQVQQPLLLLMHRCNCLPAAPSSTVQPLPLLRLDLIIFN